ncbi:MAG: hypothetical protein GXO20_08165 [Thermodesulfobacteria bacterium]|nr:hypothetical protein [Thermodesulfobacteriota bacterium]
MECPACKGNIPDGAKFCPYCGKGVMHGTQTKWWALALLAGALTGAGIFLAYQLFQEKRVWDAQGGEELPPSSLEEDLDF